MQAFLCLKLSRCYEFLVCGAHLLGGGWAVNPKFDKLGPSMFYMLYVEDECPLWLGLIIKLI